MHIFQVGLVKKPTNQIYIDRQKIDWCFLRPKFLWSKDQQRGAWSPNDANEASALWQTLSRSAFKVEGEIWESTSCPPFSRGERWEGLLSFIDGNMAGFFCVTCYYSHNILLCSWSSFEESTLVECIFVTLEVCAGSLFSHKQEQDEWWIYELPYHPRNSRTYMFLTLSLYQIVLYISP